MTSKRSNLIGVGVIILCLFSTIVSAQSFLNLDRLVRIGLVSNGHQKSFRLEPSNGHIEIFDNTGMHAIYSGKADSLVVSISKKNIFKIEIDGQKNFLNLKGEFLFSPVGKPPNYIKLTAPGKKPRNYRGSIALRAEGMTLFSLNQVDIEDYLKSVVPCEIFTRAPEAALEAQAIAARTYAIRNICRHDKAGYQLCDTVHCQVYTGIVKEIKATSQAVKQTEGKILAYGNEPANTVYHSNCGGILISSSAAWGGKPIPYLVSHLDGLKGQETFCSVGKKVKQSKNLPPISQKPVQKLIVRSFPANTKKLINKNFGHRVGLCQDGAIGMGAIGYDHRQILGFYYPGTRLLTLAYARPRKTPGKPQTPVIEPRSEEKQLPLVMAMKSEPEDNDQAELKFPPNLTQLKMMKVKNTEVAKAKSVLGALRELTGKEETDSSAGLKKVFWNPAQPDIFKSTN